jgi:hypothetical protein
MTRLDFDPDLERLGDALHASTTIALAREERAAGPSAPGRGRRADAVVATGARRTRPRVLAGGTLGLAGVGAALVVVLSGSTAAPAFAITQEGDGSVSVQLNQNSALPQVNAKLAAMGTGEQISIRMASGPASVSGEVSCSPSDASVSGPPVKVLVGTDGTEVNGSGNTGVGASHLAACTIYSASANAGNSGSNVKPGTVFGVVGSAANTSTTGNTGTG